MTSLKPNTSTTASNEDVSVQPKYQQLADLLRERLRAMPADGKLPSVRALMRRFQVSQHTVTAAMNMLEEEELIVRKPGSGVCRSSARHSPRIVYCKPLSVMMSLSESQEKTLYAACAKRAWNLSVHRFDPQQGRLFADDIQADGLILRPEVVSFDSPFLSRLLKNEAPRVVLGRDMSSAHLDFVASDDSCILRELLKGLVARGHRRIAFFVSEPPFYEVQERVKYFQEMCHLLNLESYPVLDMQSQYGDDGITRAAAFLKDYFLSLPMKKNRRKLPFTAIIACSPVGSIPALRAFHEAGIRVPEDCSVCCMGCDTSAQYMIPSLTNGTFHHPELAEACLRILDKRFQGDKSPILYERVSFQPVWRESTGMAPAGS